MLFLTVLVIIVLPNEFNNNWYCHNFYFPELADKGRYRKNNTHNNRRHLVLKWYYNFRIHRKTGKRL